MIAVMSLERAWREALALLALGLLTGLCAPAARAQAQVAFRYATTDGHLVVHALPLSASGQPHVLISRSPERFATGPHTLSVVSAGDTLSTTRVIELRTLSKRGPRASLAVNAAGEWALAASDESGLLFSLHAPGGAKIRELATPLADQVPVELVATPTGFVLVGNGGYYSIDREGSITAAEMADEGTYVAAAAMLPTECGLVSVAVDVTAHRWALQRRCLDGEGFRLHSSVEGPSNVKPNHLFRLGTERGAVLVTASAGKSGEWVGLRCAFADPAGCESASIPNVPSNPLLAVKGLHVLAFDHSNPIVVAAAEDGRGLWLSPLGPVKGERLSPRVLPIPGVAQESTALLESMTAIASADTVWLAIAHADWDPPPAVKSAAPRQRSTVVVSRIDAARALTRAR